MTVITMHRNLLTECLIAARYYLIQFFLLIE